jgi:hypothetical protein
MSYRCDRCNAIREGAELKRISEVRNVEYSKVFVRVDRKTKKAVERVDSVYNGIEAAAEEKLCEKCNEQLMDVEPKVEKDAKVVKFIGTKRASSPTYEKKDSDKKPDFDGLKKKFENRREY